MIAKQELVEHAWSGVAVSDAAIASALADLRRALGDEERRKEARISWLESDKAGRLLGARARRV